MFTIRGGSFTFTIFPFMKVCIRYFNLVNVIIEFVVKNNVSSGKKIYNHNDNNNDNKNKIKIII